MPELKCTVQSCLHNKNYYCDLDKITVGGDQAKKAAETCCDSFEERRKDSCTNSAGTASATSRISCRAVECAYNSECACSAGKVSVEGGQASSSDQTECATFRCGCGR